MFGRCASAGVAAAAARHGDGVGAICASSLASSWNKRRQPQLIAAAKLLWSWGGTSTRASRFDSRYRHFSARSNSPKRSTPELYQLLGVEAHASTQEIKDGYLDKVKLHHPDLNPSPDAGKQFDRITHAMKILGELETRREYGNDDRLISIKRRLCAHFLLSVRVGLSVLPRLVSFHYCCRQMLVQSVSKMLGFTAKKKTSKRTFLCAR